MKRSRRRLLTTSSNSVITPPGGGGGGGGGGGTTPPTSGALVGFVPGAGVGVYTGAAGYTATLNAFSTWMGNGTGVQIVTDYGYPSFNSTGRMTQIGGSTTVGNRLGPLTRASNPIPLVWSASLVPAGYTFQQVINGDCDTLFTTEATNMKNYGFTNVIWRLGWECDGYQFNWAIYKNASTQSQVLANASLFAQAFQRAVTKIRTVDPSARFEYNCGTSSNQIPNSSNYFPDYNPSWGYPGDSYVDYVGTDCYGGTYHQSGSDGSWAYVHTNQLEVIRSFANSRGKPMAMSEWGNIARMSGHGSDDNPYFMTQMIQYANMYCAYHTFFNSYDGGSGSYPTITSANAGASSLTVSSITNIQTPSDPAVKGTIRIGTGANVQEIDYTGISGKTLTGIPTSGHGSIPSGGIASGTQITQNVSTFSYIAAGSDTDFVEGQQGYRDSPHMPQSAAIFRANI